ncbi:tetratricopeptide repeat protein [Azospirillum sp. sgz301742]
MRTGHAAPPAGPDAAGWHRAVEHWRTGAHAHAARELTRLLAIAPANADALGLLGLARLGSGLRSPARQLLQRALRLDPTDAANWANLATLLKAEDPQAARRSFQRALACDPALAEAMFGCANLFRSQGDVEGGTALYARAVACRPDFAEAHEAHAHALLLLGRFKEGWAEYEWRWQVPSFPTERHRFHQPFWTGQPLEGRTILVHSEQGLGDTLQFARYLPLLAERGATVVFQLLGSHRPLLRLMGSLSGVERVTVRGDSQPDFDLHVPLLSLPHRLGGDPQQLPPCVPYLEPPAGAAARWRERLAGARGLRVGLVWAGRPEHANDAARSLALEALAPLLATPGVSWFSLQKGPAAEALAALPPGTVTDLAPDLDDFADTAAAMQALDLVISADTSPAHLAGALGVPVWVLLPHSPDWRWQLGREDSPWYPTMRLFRQPRTGAWEPVISAAAAALGRLSQEERKPQTGPHSAKQAFDRGFEHQSANRLAEAERCYEHALALDPAHGEALHLLGVLRRQEGHPERGLPLLRYALRLHPDVPVVWLNLAGTLRALGRSPAGAYRRALALGPGDAEVYNMLGNILWAEGSFAAAEGVYRRALTLAPDHPEALTNLGNVFNCQGWMDAATECYASVLARAPRHVNARFGMALARLKAGDLKRGWDFYEARWETGQIPPLTCPQPLWQGEDLTGRTILLHAEQGHGDTLQFVRYAPLVAQRGGRVLLLVQPALKRLAAGLPGVAGVYAPGDAIPPFDVHCPLMSLPRLFGTTLDSIPAGVPYLHADPAAVARWAGRLPPAQGKLRVGLVWAGDPRPHMAGANAIDRRRSLSLDQLAPLFAVEGVTFVSLQFGERRAELTNAPGPIHDPMGEVSDFADTAALVATLDLVITVDTSMCHLVGALGKPVWVLSRFDGCWRWLTERDDSPWYPTLRLFRQGAPGAWGPVIDAVASTLRRQVAPPVETLFEQAFERLNARQATQSATLLRRVLAVDPRHADALHLLGVAALQVGQRTVAEAWIGRALRLCPDRSVYWYNMAVVQRDLGRFDTALACHQTVAVIEPGRAEVLNLLGGAQWTAGRFAAAEASCRRALVLAPGNADARANLAATHFAQGRLAQAVTTFRTALAVWPSHVSARYGLSLAYLKAGDLKRGWDLFETRWETGQQSRHPFRGPQWQGEDLDGRTILLHFEQGLGDTLQFVRYAPLVAQRGGRVLLLVQPALKRLAAGLPGVAGVYAPGDAIPPFDVHCPLMSLPRLFGTTLGSIPAGVPYLHADPAAVARWAGRLPPADGRLRVGLVWAGDARPHQPLAHATDRRRSLSVDQLAPLFAVEGVTFVSLQFGERRAELTNAPGPIHDPMGEVSDFADTAALVATLDLVITVDTSMCHLVGALGKPVWVLSRFDGCWRWLTKRDDSPWYPTMRLFRQGAPGAWGPVIDAAASTLRRQVAPPVEALFEQAFERLNARQATQSATLLRRVLAVDPRHADALHLLGVAGLQVGQRTVAEAWIGRALRLCPDRSVYWCNMALVQRDFGRFDAALACQQAAAVIEPGRAEVLNLLDGAQWTASRFAAAELSRRRALVLAPGNATAHVDRARLTQAVATFRTALAARPSHAGASYDLDQIYLEAEDLDQPWIPAEDRWEPVRQLLRGPLWQGEDLAGRTILLHFEQGLGDTVQFVRYAPLVAQRGGRVLLLVQPALKRLVAGLPGVAGVYAPGDAIPPFDVHCPLMSLPRLFGTTLDSIPAGVPYLHADPAAVARWAGRLPPAHGRLRVGLAWSGGARHHQPMAHAIDHHQRLRPAHIAPLLAVEGAMFVSLQFGGRRGELAGIAGSIHDPMDPVTDFAAAAALVATLDLVITAAAAIAHLAGGLGKPVWMLPRFDASSRWLADREDSPWYPTLRLFFQDEPDSWAPVVRRVAASLRALAPGQGAAGEKDGVDAALARGIAHHKAGNLSAAAEAYRTVLETAPRSEDALHLLGLVALAREQLDDAGRLFAEALRVNAASAIVHNSQAELRRARGDADGAVADCRRALALHPAYAEALLNSANLQRLRGRPADSCRLAGWAIRLLPGHAAPRLAGAHALFDQGHLAAAADAYRRVLALEPDHAEAHDHLGRTLRGLGALADGAAAFRRAVRLRPDNAELWRGLGDLALKRQRNEEAAAFHRRALALQPDFAEVFNNLGSGSVGRRRFGEAKTSYRRAIALQPGYPDPWNNLASALWEIGEAQEAIGHYERAVALKPDHPDGYANLGYVRRAEARGAEDYAVAETACRRALALHSGHAAARNNLGIVQLDTCRLGEAQATFRRVLEHAPENADARFNLSLALLKDGRWDEGWPEYEWRWRTGQLPSPRLTCPQWKGEPLSGRTVLLHAEQGHGDTLQFVRYAPLVAARGGRVILAVQAALKRLVAGMPGVDAVYELNEPIPAGFDLHCPLLSLPFALGTTVDTVPGEVPYLKADPAAVAAWRARLSGERRLKVGLVWSGDPRRHTPRANATDRRRSLTLEAFAPLAAARDRVTFYSLQKGEPAEQLKALPLGLELVDVMDEVGDFADTAALIEALDLVISVDTSVCHLAGALGKPVWVLSRFDGCWRWLTGREDTPWYPTMRLFGQTRPGAWGPVVERVAEELAALARGDARGDQARALSPRAPRIGRSRVKLRDSGVDVDRLSVLLMCRDSERYLRHLLPALGALEASYDCAFDYVFLENGSRDDTNHRLRAFLGGREGRLVTPADTPALDALPRMERLARLRNQMIGAVRPVGGDYALLLDADIYFDERVLADLFALAPTRNNVAMLCAHGLDVVPANGRWATENHYYDTAAFVTQSGRLHWPHCIFEDCARCAGRVEAGARIARPPLLSVQSAFGGLALVKGSALRDPRVRWRTSVQHGLELCEHIHFCDTLRRTTGAGIAVACEVPVYRDGTSQGLG